MDSIVSNITGGFLNDILKATAPEREYANYQNIILPELVGAVKKYNDFKDSVLESLRSRKSQPTIKEAFAKCDRDSFAKKLNEQDAVLKECIRTNQQTSEKIDYFMRIKMPPVIVDNELKCVSPLESAHQKAREYVSNEHEKPKVEETPKVVEETPKVVEETPKVVEETPKVVEETPNIQITITENDVKFAEEVADQTPEVEETTDAEQAPNGEVEEEEETTEEVEETTDAEQAPNCEVEEEEETTEEVEEETTEEVEETTEEVEETTEEVEESTEEVEETTEEVEETTDAEQAPNGEVEVEEDVSEEEIETEEQEEEVEEYTYKGKKYYVTNTTNGKIYACTTDDDIGDQVGSFKNGKPIFS
jgi:hypothetical protein